MCATSVSSVAFREQPFPMVLQGPQMCSSECQHLLSVLRVRGVVQS